MLLPWEFLTPFNFLVAFIVILQLKGSGCNWPILLLRSLVILALVNITEFFVCLIKSSCCSCVENENIILVSNFTSGWVHDSQSPIWHGIAPKPEVKFDAFIHFKCGEEKFITNIFQFHTRTTLTFDQANKKIAMYTYKKRCPKIFIFCSSFQVKAHDWARFTFFFPRKCISTKKKCKKHYRSVPGIEISNYVLSFNWPASWNDSHWEIKNVKNFSKQKSL